MDKDNSYVSVEINQNLYNTTNKKMEYTNNNEYRSCLRYAFNMTCDLEHLMKENPDYDDETLDEELYHSEQSKRVIDFIFNKTKNNDVFRKMYLYAAGKMICMEMDLGLVVLFSYDFFTHFHECLVKFLNDGVLYEEDPNVQNILNN